MSKIKIATPMNVVPNGLPILRRREEADVIRMAAGSYTGDDRSGEKPCDVNSALFALEPALFKRNNWVTAIPIDANASEVLSHARNVRSKAKQTLLTPPYA